jgi:hypothetical protein
MSVLLMVPGAMFTVVVAILAGDFGHPERASKNSLLAFPGEIPITSMFTESEHRTR